MNDDILKDVILSTLAEIEKDEPILEEKIDDKFEEKVETNIGEVEKIENKKTPFNIQVEKPEKVVNKLEILEKTFTENSSQTDTQFLFSIQERISTLFEGLKSEEMKDKNKKLEITLKYLEYLLILIDKKLKN